MTVPALQRTHTTRPGRARRAFTLTELSMVMAVMAIIAAIAIPQLSSGDTLAADRNAQVTLEAALATSVNVHLVDGQFTDEPVRLSQSNPDIDFVGPGTDSTSPSQVSVATDGSDMVALAARGADGACWFVQRNFFVSGSSTPEVLVAVSTSPAHACRGTQAAAFLPDDEQQGRGTTMSRPYVYP